MLRKIFLMTVLSTATFSVMACDICGSGVGSGYIGLLPEFSKKIIGLRYRHNTLKTHIGAGGRTTYLTTDETYRTAELWGGWTIGNKLRIMGSLPVNFNEKKNSETNASREGLGDASVLGYYRILDRKNSLSNKLLTQSLWMGVGIKLPTGKYEVTSKLQGAQDPNIFQLGTGSTDFTINAMYDVRLMDLGINATASYKLNTKNKEGYQYGNKLSTSAQAYYKFKISNSLTIAPNAGVLLETAQRDKDNGFISDVSGGHSICGTAGVELNFNRIAIGANAQNPLSQKLANGSVKAGNRIMFHVSFLF